MKTFRRNQKKLWIVPVALAGMLGLLLWVPAPAGAQIMGDVPTLAPEVALPIVPQNVEIRIAGSWTCVAPRSACALGGPPTIEGRLDLRDGDNSEVYTTLFASVSDPATTGRYTFSATILIKNSSLPNASGGLRLVVTDSGLQGGKTAKGAFVASVRVRDTVPESSIPPYIVGLAEPRPDPLWWVGQDLPWRP